MTTVKDKERFMKYIRIDPDSGCWVFTGGIAVTGYGNFYYKGRSTLAHRASFLLFKEKEIQPGQLILHSCKTKCCCAPDHLTAGTREQNNGSDRHRDGTALTGERCHFAKLTREDVQAIRSAAQAGEKRKDIAVKYAISPSAVSSIVLGKSWRE